ncbi:hypothetical protein ACFFX1_29125 [Dactylosporangium sucinum]|uniref:Uncharacterized protein n=1 Tax=Dactylosporangium sucinum TaxID=1424081 RepID=A0A917U5J6_9ACTN|nr:hypothetical protein [Dactylosporangium sucinum]GGM56953.1 hypothetical protein GCM10007977_068330 [Dactylosporangium sucinum]
MDAPAAHRTRWQLRAGSLVLLTTVCSLVFTAPAHADPEEGPSDPPSVEVPTSNPPPPTEEPTTGPPPTTEAPPTTRPPTKPPPPSPTPTHNLKLSVSDIVVGDAYWQGDGAAELVIAVQNIGSHVGADQVNGFYVLPSGAQPVGVYGTAGCVVTDVKALSFGCRLGEGKVGRVVVKVNVDENAWKLSGPGTVTASVRDTEHNRDLVRSRNFTIRFTAQPPTPGIALSASQLELPAAAAPQAQTAQLQVKLRNTGAAKGAGAVELVTPPGVDVVSFPAACRSHRRIAEDRDRCDLGDLTAGREVAATFGLAISAAAREQLPLTGAVHGYLTPAGRPAVETRADYRITGPPIAGESPLPTDAPASPAPVPLVGGTGAARRDDSDSNLLSSEQLSSAPFVVGIVGLVAVVGFLVVLSLRRRMSGAGRDDDDELSEDEVEEVVLVPAGELPAAPMPRSPIPRSITLPRLPPGPVAGSGFRHSDGSFRDPGRDDDDRLPETS